MANIEWSVSNANDREGNPYPTTAIGRRRHWRLHLRTPQISLARPAPCSTCEDGMRLREEPAVTCNSRPLSDTVQPLPAADKPTERTCGRELEAEIYFP